MCFSFDDLPTLYSVDNPRPFAGTILAVGHPLYADMVRCMNGETSLFVYEARIRDYDANMCAFGKMQSFACSASKIFNKN
jgi:hypothetical protein